MIKIKIFNFFKQIPLWLKIVVGIISLILILILGFYSYFFVYLDFKYKQDEKIIDQKFHQEILRVPQMKITSFQLWEGDSMVTAEIENKGEVKFWYGLDGVPRIDNIDGHSTMYTCFYVDPNGKKIGYAYDTELSLKNNGQFTKWFPFEINNLSGLVERYDEIEKVLVSFPVISETVPFKDMTGERQVLEKSDPNFVVKQQLFGREVWCDLHQ